MDSIIINYTAIFLLGIITGVLIIILPVTGKLSKVEAQNTRLKREINQLKSEPIEQIKPVEIDGLMEVA